MRYRQQVDDMLSIANTFHVQLELEPTRNGHVRAIFRADDKRTVMVMAKGHGGDVRGRKNNLAKARRLLREMTGRDE